MNVENGSTQRKDRGQIVSQEVQRIREEEVRAVMKRIQS